MTRYVVRPNGILTTPRMLAQRMGATVKSKNARGTIFNPDIDFFMSYPSEDVVDTGGGTWYRSLYYFASLTKFLQMRELKRGGIRTPLDYPSQSSVVRPLRHSGGADFTVLTPGSSFNPLTHYAVPFFPKEYEYRMLYVMGTLVATLAKIVPPGTPNNTPWNHTNGSSFQQVEWDRCRLRFTTVREDLGAFHVVQNAHIIGVDVMIKRPEGSDSRGWEYAVCEFNFCPGLSIDSVIEKVIEYA